ncbi:MAG: NAD(P)-dependent oxidoreductase, partial [Synergistaceae bacterium]|nr:NAD(P)-dependent oxidoreductase [Synergistaceae bacterium]
MLKESRPPFFPMMIDIHDRDVLIIGGGHVAARRAYTLLKCGARVHAVSPEFIDEFPRCTERITREFEPEDIDSR